MSLVKVNQITPNDESVVINVSDIMQNGKTPTVNSSMYVGFQSQYSGSLLRNVSDKLQEYVSVKDFGAKGDGVTDDTAAFNQAVNSGAMAIHIPATTKSYRLTSTLNLTSSITFIGDGVDPYTSSGSPSTRGPGSWLYFDHTDVGIRFSSGSDKGGKRFYMLGTYRNQVAPASGSPFTPTVCDYDFYINDNSGFIFEDICILNAYKGFYITGGPRGTFNRVCGQPLSEGINIHESYDCVRIENIHWWVFWASNETVWQWVLDNGRSLIVNRSDGLMINNYFCIFYAYGWVFTGNSTAGDTATKIVASNVFLDECKYPYYIDETASYHSSNISNFNSQIRSTVYASKSPHIMARSQNADVNISGCNLASAGGPAVYVKDTGCKIGISNLTMNKWNMGDDANSNPAFVIESSSSSLTISGKSNISRKSGDTSTLYGGSGRVYMFLGDGMVNTTTDANGNLLVTHGFNTQPTFVDIQIRSDIGLMYSLTNITSTTFTIKFRTSTNSPYATSQVQFSWRASI